MPVSSDGKEILQGIQRDLKDSGSAGRVVYVEGKTDTEMLLALVGERKPLPMQKSEGVYRVEGAALIRPLGGRERIEKWLSVAGEAGWSNVFGIVDGDGKSKPVDEIEIGDHGLVVLPVYCTENYLALAGWPESWGPAPDWTRVMLDYLPYSALNVVNDEIAATIREIRLAVPSHVSPGDPLLGRNEIIEILERDLKSIADSKLIDRFEEIFANLEKEVEQALRLSHARINGKWFVEHLAVHATKKSSAVCRSHWSEWIAKNGGLEEVKRLWDAILSRPRSS
ncbi:MAG: hypothetical protein R6V85_16500 [Polyangia bacterium]